MSLVKDIADYLEENDIGEVGTDIFYGTIPDSPDKVVGVFQYAGRVPDLIAGVDKPGLQIRVRGEDYPSAEAKIKQVGNLLRQIGDEVNETLCEGVEINGSLYLRIAPVQSAFPLGEDKKERMEFIQNFNTDIRR